MANVYVWHAAAGSGSGADWTNALTNLSSISTKIAGDTFYVAHDHAQTQGSALTVSSPGTETNPSRIFCVNRAGSVPPVAADLRTTATATTTGAFAVLLSGSVSECYGITFSAGSGAVAANLGVGSTASRSWRFVNCKFVLGGTTASNRINLGLVSTHTVLENCTVQFAAVGQGIAPIGKVTIRGPSSTTFIAGANIPTVLFAAGANAGTLFCEGVDLSNLTPGTKFLYLGTQATIVQAIFKDCKLGASVGIYSGTVPGTGGTDLTLIRCDSGDTNYRTEKHQFAGMQQIETTIVRSGGATDGTTPIAWKLTYMQGSPSLWAFDCLPISVWNETVGSAVTVTVEGIWQNASVPTNAEIYMDVEYLGTAGFPLGSIATNGRASSLATATSHSAGSGTWGGSLSPSSKFAMSVTVTPQEKGPITVYVKILYSSTTIYYIDPKPVIT